MCVGVYILWVGMLHMCVFQASITKLFNYFPSRINDLAVLIFFLQIDDIYNNELYYYHFTYRVENRFRSHYY